MEHVERCILCGSTRRTPFEQIRDSRGPLQYSLCLQCGLVYQSPRMDPEKLTRFYEQEYRSLVQGTDEPTPKDLQVQLARARTALAMIRSDVPTVAHHLDLGSSSGAVLRAFQAEYGCASVGIEPGETYRQSSQGPGLTIYPSLESLRRTSEARFDLVTLLHVLEHIPDPVATLRELVETWMTPGGALLVELPNLIEHEALERSHLFGFTAATLRETVLQAGLRVVWTRAHGSFRSPILMLYLTVLARNDGAAAVRRRVRSTPFGIKFRRRLGRIKRDFFTRHFPDWTWQSPQKNSSL